MKAVVFAGEGSVRVDDVPEARLVHDDDALVKVSTTSICGSDLHILAGKTPGMRVGGILGHEFTGTVVDAGDRVAPLVGRNVLGSFLIACGDCPGCREGAFNRCADRRALGMGTLNGDLDGAQAETVRVPHALTNLKPIDHLSDLDRAAVLFCGDILATGIHTARVGEISDGDRCAVFGAGPVGLCCALAARSAGADVVVVEVDRDRRATARRLAGLDVTETIDESSADVAVDAVGAVAALKAAMRTARDGGRVVVVGVYGAERYDLPLGRIWVRALDLRFAGMANVQGCWDDALAALEEGTIDPAPLATHRVPLDDAVEAYELFRNRSALKVLMEP